MSKRYEIREQIGKGGLGAVYRALDTQLQREVAIKRVLTASQATEEEVKEAANKLIAEAQTLSSLNHPNIVTVFDVGQDEEGGFVVMELLKGETLDDTVARGVLTQEDFTEVVYQTMEALIAAQANNVIHRDIKPTNIMVIWQASGKFQLKILDFGLAKFSKSPSVQTMDQDESVMGSIFFMAPEQFERGELDARTDLYQMGCVYYNALTGQYPFNGETAPQVMNAHLQHRVIPLEQVRPDLSPSICQWVMWLINRDIVHRPLDARDALKRWPRNPEPPGAQIAKELPVESTPHVHTGQVVVVRAGRGASAPPSLIIPSSTTRNTTLSTGGTTGRIRGGGRSSDHGKTSGRTSSYGHRSSSRPNIRKNGSSSGESNKKKWIVIGTILAIVASTGGYSFVSQSASKKRTDRITALAASETPTGDASDVALAVRLLDDPKATPSLKTHATTVLTRLEGSGINEAIFAKLKEANTLPLKISLARTLAERNYRPAVPEMMNIFKSATTDEQRSQILQAVRAIASTKQINDIIGALHGQHTLPIRREFEDTVLAVLRQSSNNEEIVDSILKKISSSKGGERQSLFRILGSLGNEKVKELLKTAFAKADNKEYQYDAIGAYRSWPNRSVLPDLETLIESTKDEVLRASAENAYIRLITLPGPEPVSELVPLWRKAFENTSKPSDIENLCSALLEYPDPETLKLLKEWVKHPTNGRYVKNFLTSLERSMQNIVELKPGDEIRGNRARILGDKRAKFNSALSSLTEWVSPETWFAWYFKVTEAGDYLIEVDQSSLRDESSEFIVYLAGETLHGSSKRTSSLGKFETIRLEGLVTLEPEQIYSLMIVPGATIQSRMMDIGAIRLVKPK